MIDKIEKSLNGWIARFTFSDLLLLHLLLLIGIVFGFCGNVRITWFLIGCATFKFLNPSGK